MKTLQLQTYGGIDWHDSKETTTYIKENGSYDISDPEKTIEEEVVKAFKEFCNREINDLQRAERKPENPIPDIIPSEDEIRKAVREVRVIVAGFDGDTYELDGEERKYYETALTYIPAEREIVYEYLGGQITQHVWFVVHDIPDENVRYLATENFLCPNKGIPSVSRFYSLPVKTQEEAEKQLEELQLHDRNKDVWAKSVKELAIIDVDVTPNTTWYALNIQAIRAEESLKETLERYNLPMEIPFRMYAKVHIEALEEADKNAYNKHMDSLAKKAGFA